MVVPDQRGHGRSDRGEPESWNLGQWAADVKEFADTLGIECPVVLGESFGGFVAQQYAGTYPEHPGGLILVCCGPRFATGSEIAEHIGGSRGAEVAALITSGASPDETVEEAVAEWTRLIDPLLAVRRDPVLERVESLRISTFEVNRHFEAEGFSMDLRPLLSQVRCPTLVIVGEHDILVPPPLRNEFRDAIPPGLGRVEVVPNASHSVLTDNPSFCWRLIREFIANLE